LVCVDLTTAVTVAAAFLRIGYDTIGGSWRNNPNSAFLAATIDDAAFYTTALTATTIANHYLAGR
jgi:hypothetical protein